MSGGARTSPQPPGSLSRATGNQRPLLRSAPPDTPPVRPAPSPPPGSTDQSADCRRARHRLPLLCKYKGGKRRPGAAGGRVQRRVGRRVGSSWELQPKQAGIRERGAAVPDLPAYTITASAPVARSPGHGWMRRGPCGGGPPPPAPRAPRGGVRGPGAPRRPCAEAGPETAGGLR